MDNLPERIKLVRTTAGVTQQEFAKALGTHQNTIGRWERGQAEPDLNSVSLLCSKFGISPYWLLSGNGPMLEKDRDIKFVAGPGTKASELRPYKASEVSGGPKFDATMAQLQARLMQVEKERDEAREAELRAKDEALKAKDQALEALQVLAFKGREKDSPSIEDEPETTVAQHGLPESDRKSNMKK